MKTFLLSTIAIFLFSATAFSQYYFSYYVDSSFGVKGRVTVPPGPQFIYSTNFKMDVYPDGKIVSLGDSGYTSDFYVTRFFKNGAHDLSFGNNGLTILKERVEGNKVDLLIQPDGKILAYCGFALFRINYDGSLDNNFGSGGSIDNPNMERLALQSDGKIILLKDRTITRLNTDGTIDNSFGNNGSVYIDGPKQEYLELAVDSKDRIFCVGQISVFPADNAVIKCFLKNGTLDASFGTNGMVQIFNRLDTKTIAEYITIQDNDNIIIGGRSYPVNDYHIDLLLAKLMPDGSFDLSFKDNGKTIYRPENQSVFLNDVQVSPTGNMMFLGENSLASFKADGFINNNFGNNGEISIPGGYNNFFIYAIKYQENNLLIGGEQSLKFVLGRLKSEYSGNINASVQNGLSFQKEISISVFPNPVNSIIYISGLDAASIATITIMDSRGNALRTVISENSELKVIDAGNLNPGIYYLQVLQNNQIKTLKIIKQ